MEQIAQRWVRFPVNQDEQILTKRGFMEKFNFPGVVGCVDCSHVAILAPHIDEHLYFNRKRFHSKNVQIISDSNLKILNVNANFPGSTHDAFIWSNSGIYTIMSNNYYNGNRNSWLLGDSGYPTEPWLLTPVGNPPPGSPEARYNSALCSARNCVERCIGKLL